MKTKLSILLIGMAFCYSSQLKAQFQNFDLSKYKVVDYQRKQLDFDFSLSGNHQNYGNENGSSTNNIFSSFSSNLQAMFSGVTNSRKLQTLIIVFVSLVMKVMKAENYWNAFRITIRIFL